MMVQDDDARLIDQDPSYQQALREARALAKARADQARPPRRIAGALALVLLAAGAAHAGGSPKIPASVARDLQACQTQLQIQTAQAASCHAQAAAGTCDVVTLDAVRFPDGIDHGFIRGVTEGLIVIEALPRGGYFAFLGAAGIESGNYAGPHMLFNLGGGDSRTEVKRTDDGVFDLVAIAFAEFAGVVDPVTFQPMPSVPFTITLTGVRPNGTTVTTTVTVPPFPEVTIAKVDLPNLVSVSWPQDSGVGPGHSRHQFGPVVVRIR
jgi:hypothetical protein